MILEVARNRGDFDSAAEAKRELERLGIRITFKPRREVTNAS
jgi:hypothetical protein